LVTNLRAIIHELHEFPLIKEQLFRGALILLNSSNSWTRLFIVSA